MASKQHISENLIGCRNILLNGRINEHILPCLEAVLAEIDLISIVSTKKIIEYCTLEAIKQIKDSNFISAGFILSFIHNLPLDEASEQSWDIDYFLWMELPAFLEHFDEIQPARQISLYVCKQLACKYLLDED
ncbi:MAG: hypothetical protein KBC57_12570 [Neisseriaceae bacterium]|nr:hypothetical protein [Neisseriaceae bacterium]